MKVLIFQYVQDIFPHTIMTALLKEKIKRGKREMKKRGKILSPEQAEKTMRRPEFRTSRMGF